MTTSNKFDNLNRPTRKASQTGTVAVATFGYTYNAANQRTAITNTDSSRWSYGYDTLGQVTSGKRYWSDGNIVAGQQFEYSFDDIGNRLRARRTRSTRHWWNWATRRSRSRAACCRSPRRAAIARWRDG